MITAPSTRSLNVQTYIDARIVADLVWEFRRQNVPHKSSYSHMVYTILCYVHTQWNARRFESTEDALDYLVSEGFSIRQLKTPGRGEKLLRVLHREVRESIGVDMASSESIKEAMEKILAEQGDPPHEQDEE